MFRFCCASVCLAAAFGATMKPVALAQEQPSEIVFLGDSISAGYGLENPTEEAFPGLISEKIRTEKLPYAVVNAGVSGDTSAGGLSRIDWLLRKPVAVLVLELGGNDGLRGLAPEQTRRNLLGVIEKTRARNPEVKVLLTGMRMPDNFGADYVREFAATFPAVAKEGNATLLPFLLDGVGGREDLNQADHIHPTAAGHRIIADAVWAALKPLL